MHKIGVPENNLLLVNAGRIRALILEEKAIDLATRGYRQHQNPELNGLYNVYFKL